MSVSFPANKRVHKQEKTVQKLKQSHNVLVALQ